MSLLEKIIQSLTQNSQIKCQCSMCHRQVEERDIIAIKGRPVCRDCAGGTDAYLNEIQMEEGGYDCGRGIEGMELDC